MINITLLEGNILLPTLWNPLLLYLLFLSKNISVEKSPYRIPEDEAANILNHVSIVTVGTNPQVCRHFLPLFVDLQQSQHNK